MVITEKSLQTKERTFRVWLIAGWGPESNLVWRDQTSGMLLLAAVNKFIETFIFIKTTYKKIPDFPCVYNHLTTIVLSPFK